MAFSLEGFAAAMMGSAVHVEESVHRLLKEAAVVIESSAKEAMGTYTFGWPPLAPSTVARKANGDTPLVETGEMRDSIEHEIGNREAWVGTNDPKAKFHEFGTSRIPPRPFLGGAVIHKQAEIEHILKTEVAKALKIV